MVKAQEVSSRDRVEGDQRRRQELQSAARMLYVLLRPTHQLLLPLPHDGFSLRSSLDTSHSKNVKKEITSKCGMGSFSTNWPPLVTQQHQSMLGAVMGVEWRRSQYTHEVVLLSVVRWLGHVPYLGA